MAAVTIEALSPSDPRAEHALLLFMEEMSSRWLGRPATEEDVGEALREFPTDELLPPDGLLLVAHRDGAAEGCAGLRELRLDTRGDLVEARRLYDHLGYQEIEPFGDNPYAAHWFAKRLDD